MTRLVDPDYVVDIFYIHFSIAYISPSLHVEDYRCTGDDLHRLSVLGMEPLQKTTCTEYGINLTGHSVFVNTPED